MSQSGMIEFKNLAANDAWFLECARPFWNVTARVIEEYQRIYLLFLRINVFHIFSFFL